MQPKYPTLLKWTTTYDSSVLQYNTHAHVHVLKAIPLALHYMCRYMCVIHVLHVQDSMQDAHNFMVNRRSVILLIWKKFSRKTVGLEMSKNWWNKLLMSDAVHFYMYIPNSRWCAIGLYSVCSSMFIPATICCNTAHLYLYHRDTDSIHCTYTNSCQLYVNVN